MDISQFEVPAEQLRWVCDPEALGFASTAELEPAGEPIGQQRAMAADTGWGLGPEVEFAKYACEVGADMLMAKPPTWAASCTSEDKDVGVL